MRFSPGLLDEIRARLPVSQVVARKVKLKRQGREFAGLSPFKVEKTPSFFVNDQKGFYHCFASAEHGDIFTFVMKTEGLSFPEAVERLASEAGVTLPKPTEHDAEREDERTRLLALMEEACKFFQEALAGPSGKVARDYLTKRGLDRRTLGKFRIGFAPNSRTALKTHLASTGFNADEMAKAGMVISGEDIPVPYDRFRNRVIFPIGDLRGKVIAFGGRALDPAARAKYLNSPETPLFHKGHILFNGMTAREAAHTRGEVIVVEGYMDVVALAEAGIDNVVAPLGTALTQDQLRLLWRMAPEPTLCFDGDEAGRKAAHRALETALPNLSPGHSLRFAFLPDGLDPDDLVRQSGPQALQDCLKQAKPMVDMLWDGLWETGEWSTPERRARLEADVMSKVAQIDDANVRAHYLSDIRGRLAKTWGTTAAPRNERSRPTNSGRRSGAFRAGSAHGGMRTNKDGAFARSEPAVASASLRGSGVVAGPASALPSREALLISQLINQPWLLRECAEEVAALTLTSLPLMRLRDALLVLQVEDLSLDNTTLRHHLDELGFGSLVGLIDKANSHKADKFAEPDADPREAERGWRHVLALHRQLELKQALQAALDDFYADGSENSSARIAEINRQLNEVTTNNEMSDDGNANKPIHPEIVV